MPPSERFGLYASMFDLVWSVQRDPESVRRLETWNWQQKLAAFRRHLVDAFRKLDELNRKRSIARDGS